MDFYSKLVAPGVERYRPLARLARWYILLLAFTMISHSASAQHSPFSIRTGIDFQVYPAGLTAVARLEKPISPFDFIRFHGGLNVTNRRDYGKHDHEDGQGPGFGFAWRHFLRPARKGLLLGVRSDLWFLKIDWRNGAAKTGSTDVMVFQPTAQIGYGWQLSHGAVSLETTASLGAEINIHTSGEEVGSGAIFLLGAGISWHI